MVGELKVGTLVCPECGNGFLRGAKFCAHCGTLLTGLGLEVDPNDPLAIGTLLGNYRILELIGEGGMGRVYIAEHIKLGRRVAMKMLRPELASNAVTVARFFAEARAVNQISHENIVEITDFLEQPGGDNCIIMELLRGADLGRLIERKGVLSLPRALDIAGQIANALATVHAAGIVHRDLKPDNIFLIERGGNPDFVKLVDFGVAKLTDPTGRRGLAMHTTAAGQIIGTPEYMSPEQAGGQEVDHRTDIYALGVIFYEMVTGRLPFQAKNFGELLMKHMTASIELPEREPGLPPGVQSARDQLILALLAKDANDRPRSMRDVEQQIQDVLAAMELPAAPKKRATTSGSHTSIRDRPESSERSRPKSEEASSRPGSMERERTRTPVGVARIELAAAGSVPAAKRLTPDPAEPVARLKLASHPAVVRSQTASRPIETRAGVEQGSDRREPVPPRHHPALERPVTGRFAKPGGDRLAKSNTAAPANPNAPQRLTQPNAESTPLETRLPTGERSPRSSVDLAPLEPQHPTAPPLEAKPPSADRIAAVGTAPNTETEQPSELVVTLRSTRSDVVAATPALAIPPEPMQVRRSRPLRSWLVAAAMAVGVVAVVWFALRGDAGPVAPAALTPSAVVQPEARPAEVRIKFVSAPPGATVRIAGTPEDLGITPFTKTFPRGSLSLAFQFSKPGYTTSTETITLQNDDALATSLSLEPVAVRPEPPIVNPPRKATGGGTVRTTRPDSGSATKPIDRNGTMDVFPTKR